MGHMKKTYFPPKVIVPTAALNEVRKGGWIQTYTGHQFWGMDAHPDEIFVEDIAHALACVNRYNGHTKVPYSVAQHSVYVSMECAPEDAFWGLMHDASEAYICDLISPVKRFLPAYVEVENALMLQICRRFVMAPDMPASVKRADLTVLAAESRDLFPKKPADWNLPFAPVARKIKPVSWQASEKMFMKRFNELWPKHMEEVQNKIDALEDAKAIEEAFHR